MSVLLALLLLAVVAYQWLSQEVEIKLWGPMRVGFHRDWWPAFYSVMMSFEAGLAGLLLYFHFD
jgi:hypothetical protein